MITVAASGRDALPLSQLLQQSIYITCDHLCLKFEQAFGIYMSVLNIVSKMLELL